MPATAFAFNAATKTFAIATSTTGSTGVQITNVQGTSANPLGSQTTQYYVVNAAAGFLFFVLEAAQTTAALPSAGNSAAGYVLPPNSAGVFSGPENAWFSGDLDTGTGTAYVSGGQGL